jgi:hypothetical protein
LIQCVQVWITRGWNDFDFCVLLRFMLDASGNADTSSRTALGLIKKLSYKTSASE